MSEPRSAPVVVGVDGSAESEVALDWGIEEARRRGAPLRVVSAFTWHSGYPWLAMRRATPAPLGNEARGEAQQIVDASVATVRRSAPALPVTGATFEGHPVQILAQESEHAAVVVIGSRGRGALGSMLAGSTGAGLAAHLRGPLIVVRGPAGEPAEDGGVVVGVDGSAAGDAALEFGFEHADRYGVPLRAVHCWRPDLLAALERRVEPPAPERIEQWLGDATAQWEQKYPHVRVIRTTRRDTPVTGLLAESAGQQLLVVGTRGHVAGLDTMLGSTAQGVLHHATCPVGFVPAG
jgi:nucleotide-binding universal stress UspA family protein